MKVPGESTRPRIFAFADPNASADRAQTRRFEGILT
jgi:hypothetical protein